MSKFQVLIEVFARFFRDLSEAGFFCYFLKSSFLKVLILGVQNQHGFVKKLCTLML